MKKILFLLFLLFVPIINADLLEDLTSYWKLDEASGSVIDEQGNATSTNNGATTGVTGIIGNAYDFEASENDWITLGADLFDFQGTTAFSVQLWIKIESDGDYNTFAHEINPTQQYGMKRRGIDKKASIETNGASELIGNTDILIGNWYHIVYVLDTANVFIYVNGSEDAVKGSRTSIQNGADTNGSIGRRDWAGSHEYFDGIIDEVAVWKRALSAAEVSELYNNGTGFAYPFITDSCTYSGSGNFVVDCADNCTISSNVIGDGNNFSCIGSGTFIMDANVSNFTRYTIGGACTVTCRGNAGCFKL